MFGNVGDKRAGRKSQAAPGSLMIKEQVADPSVRSGMIQEREDGVDEQTGRRAESRSRVCVCTLFSTIFFFIYCCVISSQSS